MAGQKSSVFEIKLDELKIEIELFNLIKILFLTAVKIKTNLILNF